MIIITLIIFISVMSQYLDLDLIDKLTIEEKKELYKIEIHPKEVMEGIKAGRVILYGHYVEEPYKVEIKGDSLFINGVRAYPQWDLSRKLCMRLKIIRQLSI